MKRNAKFIGLAGLLLVLCLLLAGCQQAQEENSSVIAGAEQTASRYATLPPADVVTVTPDLSWNEPDEELTGDQPGQTADQNGDFWENMGTNPMASATPQYPGDSSYPFGTEPVETMTMAPVTPSPTPGPTATPKSLQVGFNDSDEVREM